MAIGIHRGDTPRVRRYFLFPRSLLDITELLFQGAGWSSDEAWAACRVVRLWTFQML